MIKRRKMWWAVEVKTSEKLPQHTGPANNIVHRENSAVAYVRIYTPAFPFEHV